MASVAPRPFLSLISTLMKLLLLGSGGREHALAWKIAQSPKIGHLYIAPGNPGTAQVGENVPIKADDFDAIGRFVIDHQVDMVVVGLKILWSRAFTTTFSTMSICAVSLSSGLPRPEQCWRGRRILPKPSCNVMASRRQLTARSMAHKSKTVAVSRNAQGSLRAQGRRPLCRKRSAHPPHAGRSTMCAA